MGGKICRNAPPRAGPRLGAGSRAPGSLVLVAESAPDTRLQTLIRGHGGHAASFLIWLKRVFKDA